MKLGLSSFFIILFFLCGPAYAKEFYKEFNIKVSGIKIGKLIWTIKIDDTYYLNSLKLKSEGFMSAIYRFSGEYYSEGFVKNNKLNPTKYSHVWKTKKIKKNMELTFKNNRLHSLNQTPYEKEKLRVDVFNIKKAKDPITSFLQIILGENSSLVVDGRRVYTMKATFNKKNNKTVVDISNYSNLWADHKRSKFEKITFEKKSGSPLPLKINIYFDGRVFGLEQI
tara:strand:+ start:1362 stop:2033 length:672 start_codon:yes stop_codon:yes gene_type:complete